MNKFRAVWYVAAAFLLAATALAPLATDPAPAEAATSTSRCGPAKKRCSASHFMKVVVAYPVM